MRILTGSNMNPFTPVPLPKAKTIIVALPYNAYPAAINFLPDCKTSLSVGGPSSNFLLTKNNLIVTTFD